MMLRLAMRLVAHSWHCALRLHEAGERRSLGDKAAQASFCTM